MPSEARRLHPFTVVSRALRLARQLLLPAIVGGASVGDDFSGTLLWILVILSVPSLAIAAAQWLVFRFRLERDELIIDSGVIARRKRVIPIDRVQNVDLEQSALERLVGVAELRIETASGGRDTEASLTVLSVAEARSLQSDLLARRAAVRSAWWPAAPEAVAEAAVETRLLRLSPFDLAVAGATSNEAGLIAVALATLLEVAGDFVGVERLGTWIEETALSGAGLGVIGALAAVAILAIVFLVLGWLVSIVVTVVRFHGFTLTRVGDDLRREYGLLSRHHTTVPLERIQAVRIEETLLRRPLGLAALKIETAGIGPHERRRGPGGGAEAYVPIARRRDVGPLLRAVFEDARFTDVALEPVAPASRKREFLRLLLVLLLITAFAAGRFGPDLLALLLLAVPAWYVARARYTARGWARTPGYILARNGVLTRTSWVVPERKIQTLHLRETPVQRRWHLATLLIDTAASGRSARVIDLERVTGAALLQQLAADAEAARHRAPAGRP